jgi:hypothetical protein
MTCASVSLWVFYLACGGYGLSLVLALLKRERIAAKCFVSAFALHALSQLCRGWYLGFFYANPMVNEISFLPWCLALIGLMLRSTAIDLNFLKVPVIPVWVFALIAVFWPQGILAPFPKNQIFLSPLFFGAEVMAHACFVLGAWTALLYLCKKTESRVFHDLVLWGFVFYSISQVVGALWAYLGWGSPFHWADRHLGSAAIWCYYAAYIHLSFVAKWDLRGRARIAMLGIFFIIAFSTQYQLMEMVQMIRR